MFSIKPARQGVWDWRAAGNFIFGGTGAGAMIMTAFAAMPVIPSVLVALAFVGAGLGLVWLEIGRPWRFLNVFRNPRTSWMTREAYAGVALFAVGLGAAFWSARPLILVAAMLALIFVYAQARILNAARGVPAWREPVLVPLMLATALVEGCAVAIMLNALGEHRGPWLLHALILLLVARGVLFILYRNRLTGGQAPVATVRALAATARTFWLVAAGTPLALAAVALIFAQNGEVIAQVAALSALLGGWLLKYDIVCRLAHLQGLAVTRMPVRGVGHGGDTARPGWGKTGL